MPTTTTSPGDDTIDVSSAGFDVIYTLGGNDNVWLGANARGWKVYLGDGNDLVNTGFPGGNTIDGGDGSDTLSFECVDTWYHPLTINLETGYLTDAKGSDRIFGFETVLGGAGDDTITGNAANNYLYGGMAGTDTIEGGLGEDRLVASATSTLTYAHSTGAVVVDMGRGEVWGGEDFDRIQGFGTVIGSDYNDLMTGSSVGLNAYHFVGGGGNDTLMVGSPWWIPFDVPVASTLDGGTGFDTLIGCLGNDLIIGGADGDTMTGGGGNNTFRFDALGDIASDRITDFAPFLDKLDFSAVNGLAFIGAAAFSGVAGQMRYRFDGANTVVEVDTDGDRKADRSLTLENGNFALTETAPGSRILWVADNTPPTLVSLQYPNWWTDNKPNICMSLTFSEAIAAGTGTIEYHKKDGTLVWTSSISASSVDIDGNVASFGGAVTLDPATEYYAVISAGTFTDRAGNPMARVQTPSFTTGATGSNFGPGLIGQSPKTGTATADFGSLAPDGTVTLVFNAPVFASTGSIYFTAAAAFFYYGWLNYVQDVIYEVRADDASQVTYNGNTVTIHLAKPLPGNLPIDVTYQYAAFVGADGRPASSQGLRYITTPAADTTPPRFVSAVFGDGSAIASQDSNLVLTFSEDIREGIWGSNSGYMFTGLDRDGQVCIYRSDGQLIVAYDSSSKSGMLISGNTVTIDPNLDLMGNTDYYVEVGVFAFEDYAGNFVNGATYWNNNITALSVDQYVPYRVLSFHTGNLLKGTEHNDVMPGTGGADTMLGYAGDDTLTGGAGSDSLDGGTGVDTAVYSGNRSAYTISRGAGGAVTVSGADGTDTLTHIEYAKFADQTVYVGTQISRDFDGDGKSDILWENTATGQDMIWLMNGSTRLSMNNAGGAQGSAWKIIGSGDFDGDGKADIVWENTTNGQDMIWLMNGATRTTMANAGGAQGSVWKIIGTGDFDGDGKSDILWEDTTRGQDMIWLMNGTTRTVMAAAGGAQGAEWKIVGTGDFNGDGKSDILWENTTNGQDMIWLMNGTTRTAMVSAGGAQGAEWKIVGTGDFDGDGKSDILWENTNTGQDMIWLMDGTTRRSMASAGGPQGAGWNIVGTGDYNGDGKSDILWEYAPTGQDMIWLMNGTTRLSMSCAGGAQGSSWLIVGGA